MASIGLGVYFGAFYNKFEITIYPINPEDLGVDEWLEDFEYLYNYIEDNYPYLTVKNRSHGFNWLDLKNYFIDQIQNAEDNDDFLKIIFSAVNALQNRHTFVMNPDLVQLNYNTFKDDELVSQVFTEEVYDAAAYWLSSYDSAMHDKYGRKYDLSIIYEKGEYVVFNYNSSWETTFGNRTIITHVDGIPVDTAILSTYDKDYLDYDFYRSKNYVWSIDARHFGYDASYTIRNSTGYETDVKFGSGLGYSELPYYYPGTAVNYTKFESDSIGYLYVSKFYGSGVENAFPDILNFCAEIENYDHLILDIRGNTGGFYSFWREGIVRPLIDDSFLHVLHSAYRTGKYVNYIQGNYLTDEVSKNDFDYLPPEVKTKDYKIYKFWQTIDPSGSLNFTGEIHLLIDNIVYSAAEGFLHFCKTSNFVDTIYGIPSGGDGLMIWPLYFVLPNSKLVINSACSLGLNPDGYANEEYRTQPDVFYESSYGDWDELILYTISDILSS
jgi:hypothetical protein